jgi:nucleotide-binding universal stress UspA family protein
MLKIKRILCPVDLFTVSDKAAHYAAEIAGDYGATVHLLHVVAPLIPAADEYAINAGAIMKSVEQASATQMKKLVAELKSHVVEVTSEVRTGNVHGVIKQAISAIKPDLVVMGSHARSGFERFFMGSVAEWLMHNSPVPVLVVSEKQRSGKAKRPPARRAA